MKDVTLIDEELVIWHGWLGSIYPGKWSQVLAQHFGGSEDSWYIALTTVYLYWDAPSVRDRSRTLISSGLDVWHDTRRRIVEHWIKRAKHEEPSLQEVTISRDALKPLEREAGRLCKQASDRFRIRVMQCLARRGSQFAIVSPDTPAELIRGILDGYDAVFPVIGPEEMGQVGFEGLAWETLASIVGADPSASRFISRQQIDGWSIVPPPLEFEWKSLEAFLGTHMYEENETRYISTNSAASEKAYQRLVRVTRQDFGSDFEAWEKWLVAQSQWHWISLLRLNEP